MRTLALITALVLTIAVGCGGESGNGNGSDKDDSGKSDEGGSETYTDFPASAKCPAERVVGERADFVIRFRNTSGRSWRHTIFGKSGDDQFVKHGVTDQDGRSGTPLQDGTGNIDFGRTPAGERRTILASEVPKEAGNFKVKLTIWGADDESELPESFPAVTCEVTVDPG